MTFRSFAALVLFLCLASACWGQIPTRESAISTSGDAEVRVAPDEVIINVGVETVNRGLRLAKDANEAAIQRALAVARRYGVPAERIQTNYVEVEPRYHSSDTSIDLLAYFVRRSMTVRLRDIKQFDDLLTDLLDAGINHVNGIEWRTTELRKYRDQARSMAIKAAQEKAEALAKDIGRTVGKAISVSEEGIWWGALGASWWGGQRTMMQNVVSNAGGPGGSDLGTVAGQISVTARVHVSFALE